MKAILFVFTLLVFNLISCGEPSRAQGVGVGWVSILDPQAICLALDVPASWKLIAYLCAGYPQEEHLDPELERHHWQEHLVESEKLHWR